MINTKPPRNKYADHAVDFINRLTLTGDYSGQPFDLRPWQETIIRRLFGTLDNRKRPAIRKATILLPRGSGKTSLSAAMVLYQLAGTMRRGQQILSIATERQQAALLFDAARQMVEQDKFLSQLLTIVPSQKRIINRHTNSFYFAMSSASASKLGYAPSAIYCDEFEEFRGKNVDLYHNLTSGFGKRTDTLLVHIMTGSDDRNTIGYEELEYAKRVESGAIKDPTYLPILYYCRDDESWEDEKVWRRVSPALGDFLSLDHLRSEYQLAKLLPSRERVFRSRYLNQWTDAHGAWIADSVWMQNAEPPIKNPSTIWVAGLDLAAIVDCNAFVLLGKRPDGKFDVVPYFWISEAQIKKRTTSDFDFGRWVREGYMKATPGETTNQEIILDDIKQICQQHRVKHILADSYLAGNWIAPAMLNAGLPLQYIHQTKKHMSPPLKQLERLTLDNRFCHGGNPVLRWMLANVKIDIDAQNNYLILKNKTRQGSVDGIQSLAMAIAGSEIKEEVKPVVVEDGSIFVL